MRSQTTRGSILTLAVTGAAVLALGTFAALAFHAGSPNTPASAPSAPGIRRAQPQELAMLLTMIDLNPEALAAAGVSSLQCEGIFDAASAYCLQADRVGQFQLAHRNLNAAKAWAVRSPRSTRDDGEPPTVTVAQAKGALEDLKQSTFQFVTTGLAPAQVQLLAKIRANAKWGIPAQYLTVDHTNRQWMVLRGALSDKRRAAETGEELPPTVAQTVAEADADPTVASAKASSDSSLNTIKQTWAARENAGGGGPP